MSTLKPEVFQIPSKIKANCYVFALAPDFGVGGYTEKRMYKARPGDKCEQWRGRDFNFNSCEEFEQRIKCDNEMYVERLPFKRVHERTKRGYHLMAAILSPERNTDFHFLRRVPIQTVVQNWKYFRAQMIRADKHDVIEQFVALKAEWVARGKPLLYLWIHQRGWSRGGPVMYDARDKLILNPKKANYNYGHLNYSKFCGIFKVRSRKATVTAEYDY